MLIHVDTRNQARQCAKNIELEDNMSIKQTNIGGSTAPITAGEQVSRTENTSSPTERALPSASAKKEAISLTGAEHPRANRTNRALQNTILRRLSTLGITVKGYAFHEENEKWSIKIAGVDWDEKPVEVSIPMSDRSNPNAVQKTMEDAGFKIKSNKDVKAISWLLQNTHPKDRVYLVERGGWRLNENVFILGDNTIGISKIGVKYERLPDSKKYRENFQSAGTLRTWQVNVSKPALHSPGLVLSISLGFAAPLLQILGIESGGFHFFAPSSSGKTLLCSASVSLYAGMGAVYPFNGTPTGIEDLAIYHDGLSLVLDEAKQLDPNPVVAAKKARSVAYQITGGKRRARSVHTGNWNGNQNWKVFLLTTGEDSMADLANMGNTKRFDGEELRLIDVPVDEEEGMGIFRSIPERCASPGDFWEEFHNSCEANHGTAMPAYLDRLTHDHREDREGLQKLINKFIDYFMREMKVDRLNGREVRFAKRFALAYAGARLATKYNVLPWTQKETLDNIRRCYTRSRAYWLAARGDLQQLVSHIRKQVLLGGNPVPLSEEQPKDFAQVLEMKGFVVTTGSEKLIAIPSNRLKDWISGQSLRNKLLNYMVQNRIMRKGPSGKFTSQVTIVHTGKRMRCYCFYETFLKE
ncbi:MAG: DUF927 domain-containing protein [Magnetococcales bacterium]|nr:DUF927 domain-containing protein [Magnetococcales bacterium]